METWIHYPSWYQGSKCLPPSSLWDKDSISLQTFTQAKNKQEEREKPKLVCRAKYKEVTNNLKREKKRWNKQIHSVSSRTFCLPKMEEGEDDENSKHFKVFFLSKWRERSDSAGSWDKKAPLPENQSRKRKWHHTCRHRLHPHQSAQTKMNTGHRTYIFQIIYDWN